MDQVLPKPAQIKSPNCSISIEIEPLNCSSMTDTEPLSCSSVTDTEPLNCSTATVTESLNCSTITVTESLNCSASTDRDLEESSLVYSDEPSSSTTDDSKREDPVHVRGIFSSTPSKQNCSGTTVLGSSDESPILPENRRRKRKLEQFIQQEVLVLQLECCPKRCMKTLSPLDLEMCELEIGHKNGTDKKQFILDNIRDKFKPFLDPSHASSEGQLVVHGKAVCKKAWCNAYGVTYRQFKGCVALFRGGTNTIVHGNSNCKRMSEKTTLCLGWMRYLFERIGDWLPHKSTVHLPPSYTKKALYERMVREFGSREILQTDIISYEYFTAVWTRHLPNFVISKRSEFTECTTCTQLKERRDKAVNDVQQSVLRDLMTQHATIVENERREYHTARERSRRHPMDQTTIIIDGMDQSKTDVPHLIRRDKGSVHLSRLPVHITGVLVHTGVAAGKIPIIFIDHKQVPHDSNLTIHCLVQSLSLHQEKLGKALFLQLDNCYRENKNRYMMGFAALLVQLDVFEEVTMHFLPVGHTHEDVDQLFSCISSKIRKTDIHTLNDMEIALRESYSPEVSIHYVVPLLNVKHWLEPHLFGDFHNHSHPHWFRFTKVDGVCRMHWRMWVSSPWEPQLNTEDSEDTDYDYHHGFRCLKSTPALIPTPSWVEPCLEKIDVPALKKDILHSEGYRLRLPDDAREWWEQFFHQVIEWEKIPDMPETWSLCQLQDNCHTVGNEQMVPREYLVIQEQIAKEYPKVTIGNQGREKTRDVSVHNSRSSIEEGQLVAVHLEDTFKRPYIGKVLKKGEQHINLHWLKGSWGKEWKELYAGKGKHRKPHTDNLPIESIILWGFCLTSRGCINSATKKELKRKYCELDGKQ